MLRLESVYFSVGGAVIVDDVCGVIETGEVVAIVGPNGAGKSTLFRMISGFLKPSGGDIILNGKSLVGMQPDGISRAGLVRMFQGAHLAWNLSALENVQVALRGGENIGFLAGFRKDSPEMDSRSQALELLEKVGLAEEADRPARELSFGQQRLIALARALAHSGSVMLLDEPFTGLKREALQRVVALLRDTARKGISVCVIDHRLDAVALLAQRFWFMKRGKKYEFNSLEGMIKDRDFRMSYFGADEISGQSESQKTDKRDESIAPVMTFADLSGGYGSRQVLQEASAEIYSGEVIGIVGPNGSGKSTLLRILAGLARQTRGSIELVGRSIENLPTHRRMQQGLRFLPQEARILSSLSPRENERLSQAGLGRSANNETLTRKLVSLFHYRDPFLSSMASSRTAGSLSGGEQAWLALSCLTLGESVVLLLDEPTSGMDGIGLEVLIRAMNEWKAAGKAIVIAEHNQAFLKKQATKIFELHKGVLALVQRGQGGAYGFGKVSESDES